MDLMKLLEETKNDMDIGKYNFCKDGNCTGCGKCCSNMLPMTEKEIKVIKDYIAKNNIKPVKHLAPVSNDISFDSNCPFMENSGCKRCRIYEVRPYVCRMFICDSKQRKDPSKFIVLNSIPVIVSDEFFGE